jgi:hypothetical protein
MKTITLTQGNVAIVDDDDYKMLIAHRWFTMKSGNQFYAVRNENNGKKRRLIMMHRVILLTPKGMDTDHISGDGLDNRRANLRVATRTQNNINRAASKNNKLNTKGVILHQGKYRAEIRFNGKNQYLGSFLTIAEAAAAYQSAAEKLYGEFARP